MGSSVLQDPKPFGLPSRVMTRHRVDMRLIAKVVPNMLTLNNLFYFVLGWGRERVPVLWHVCGDQKTTYTSRFFPTMWFSGIKLKL